MEVKITGVDALVKDLQDLGINRIPNYVARSLTMLAENVQTAMIEETMGHLTVRGSWIRPGTRYGINRTAAHKGNLQATVSTKAPWLVTEELDSTRRAKSGDILIPLAAVRTGRTDLRAIARKYAAGKRTGLIKYTNEKGQTILYEHGTKLSRHFLPLFLMKKSAPIPKRVHLLDNAQKKINEMYPSVMGQMIDTAIKERG